MRFLKSSHGIWRNVAMTDPLVSILIRVRDEESALRQVLNALQEQVLDQPYEVVVLDNESVDASAQVGLEAGAQVFTFPRKLFGYGRALNLGAELCEGQIVVNLSAHSIPQHPDWLAMLIQPIRDDPVVGAAYCNQTPATRVSRLEQRRFDCFPDADYCLGREWFLTQCGCSIDPYELAFFSNSACAVRRDVVLRNPFRDLPYAEDRAFIVDCLMEGNCVAYVRRAVVSYERKTTWKSARRIGYRAQVSKRLIRELSATYTGTRFRSTKETANRLCRAAVVLPATLVRVGRALLEPEGLRARSVRHALCATGATFGLAEGTLRWRHHIDALSADIPRLREARRHCVRVQG